MVEDGLDPHVFAPLLEAIPSPASLVSEAELVVIAHNRRYQELLDEPYRSEGAVGARVDEPYPEAARPHVLSAHGKVRDDRCSVTLPARRLRRRDDACYDIHVGPFDVPGERGRWHLTTFWDATDRRKAEREARAMADSLREANTQLTVAALDAREREAETAAVLSAVTEGVVVYDGEGRVLSANPSAIALFGFDPTGETAESLAKRVTVRRLDGTTGSVGDLPIAGAVGGTAAVAAAPFVITAADGSEHVVQVAAAPVRLGSGAGAVSAWRDITERERLIQELAATNQALAHADRRKDEFFAVLGHELRNPLAAVANAVYVLERVLTLPAHAGDLFGVIGRQTKQLTRMVDDLLDVSRITQGRLELRCDRIDLRDVVARASDAIRVQLEGERHELSLSAPAQPIMVMADPARLEQVVANLLSNAAKYTPPGGRIDIEVCIDDGGQAVVRVADTGVGIPDDVLPHVFEMFARADRSLARTPGGLGIGLTLARRLMDLHGGSIEAYSAGPGQGSEFVVRLPALADAGAMPSAVDSVVARRAIRQGARVLIVEDNRDVANALGDLVRLLGHDAEIVHRGESALARLKRSRPPDVVLLDIGLPDIDGYEVARRLRSLSAVPGRTRLVALTGYGQPADRQRAKAAGFDHHFVKPIDPEQLRAVLGG
jgi:PAS domain S-box-containing protein